MFQIEVFWVVTPLVLWQDTNVSEGHAEGMKLIPWSRVLLETLTVTQLVRKFPAFYRTRRLITVLTRDRHWSLS